MHYELRISAIADGDLSAIYRYGFQQWGEERADAYYNALIDHFRLLCENPFLYTAVDEIRAGYRRSVCGVHSIFYRISDNHIEIMTIIGRQDFHDADAP